MNMNLRSYARVAQGFLTRKVPVYAHYGITHRCNLTCKMCGIWRYGNRKEELELPQIQQMAERMRRLGVVQLSIGGGEPFACEYLEEAAKCFADQGLNTRVLTNGVGVSEARLRKCVDYGVTMIAALRLVHQTSARLVPGSHHLAAFGVAADARPTRTVAHAGQQWPPA